MNVFRKLHPDAVQYTYWDFFRNAFERNFGWRIDHIMATGVMAAAMPYGRLGRYGSAQGRRRF